jgi:hypothetical protein
MAIILGYIAVTFLWLQQIGMKTQVAKEDWKEASSVQV